MSPFTSGLIFRWQLTFLPENHTEVLWSKTLFQLCTHMKSANNITHYILPIWLFCFASEVFCPIVGCGAHLKSLAEFEDHYNARHTACCSVCSRVYPTSRLLSIHVSEVHDSFFQAKVARGYPMVNSSTYCVLVYNF